MLFSSKWRELLEQTPNVDFYQDMVKELIVKEGKVAGVKTGLGHLIYSKAVVLTNGTFLNGIVHIGEKNFGGGRISEKAATGITEQIAHHHNGVVASVPARPRSILWSRQRMRARHHERLRH